MQNVLDIYTRLIIAVITFVVPFIIFSLTNYSKILEENAKEKEDKERKAVEDSDNDMGDTINRAEQIKQTGLKLIKIEKESKEKLKAINPKIQFIWIFSSLSLALIIIVIDYLVRDGIFVYYHYLSIALILSSLAMFSLAIVRILLVIFKVIAIITKQDK